MLNEEGQTALFQNRTDAGRQLAMLLQPYTNRPSLLVLGLPRGGVPVAYEVAQALHAPLDVCLVRKLGVPDHPELALGAIASGGIRVINDDIVTGLGLAEPTIDAVAARELKELQRRDRLYRGDRPQPQIEGRIVILVDDGIATGASMRAAIAIIGRQATARLIVAVPIAPAALIDDLNRAVDEVVCVATPTPLKAIGCWYADFSQTTDDTVRQCLTGSSPGDAHDTAFS